MTLQIASVMFDNSNLYCDVVIPSMDFVVFYKIFSEWGGRPLPPPIEEGFPLQYSPPVRILNY